MIHFNTASSWEMRNVSDFTERIFLTDYSNTSNYKHLRNSKNISYLWAR